MALLVFFWGVIVLPAVLAFYYGAIVSGIYKDPLLARFRDYGQEQHTLPLPRFLLALSAWFAAVAFMVSIVSNPGPVMAGGAPLIFWLLALVTFGAAVYVRTQPKLVAAYPRWYAWLIANASREERRRIGWAWLRIPRRLRWRLNADQASWRVWADMVRLTTIYGAYDPSSPWDRWT